MLSFSSQKGLALQSLPTNKSSLITVLDIGTTKVCCVIAKLHPREQGLEFSSRTHTIEVIGFSHQRSRGIKGGVVVDLNEAEQAIRMAVDSAERQARMTVESIIVNLSGNRMQSDAFSASVALGGSAVEDVDIKRVIEAGHSHALREDMATLHAQPIGYSLDGTVGIKDPRGMVGEKLSIDMHCVSVNEAALKNLELAINRCHLSVENFVATPYASGLSVLAGDESELGVACIDMGGGTTTVSVFSEGEFVHYDGIAVGGQHVTMDLARGLSTSLRNAELIKVKYGSVLPTQVDNDDIISIQPLGDSNAPVQDIPSSLLSKIIRPRVEETLELIRDRLNASGFASLTDRRMVLTGGAAQMTGMSELARTILAKNVRLGRPLGVSGLPSEARGAAFSTAIGLMIFPQIPRINHRSPRTNPLGFNKSTGYTGHNKKTGTGSYFGRVGRWLAESF